MDAFTFTSSRNAAGIQVTFFMLAALLLAGLAAFIISIPTNDRDASRHPAKLVLEKKLSTSKDRSRIRERLKALDQADGYGTFRMKQFLYGTSALMATISLGALMHWNALFSLLLGAALGFGIAYILDKELSREITRRRERIEAEFPAIVEMLTLALSAGETPMQAMARVAMKAQGPLALEFAIAVEAVKSGVPFHLALDEMGRRIDSIVIRRYIDALVNAITRGAPLIEVLSRHAQEARQSQRNRILAAAGKAEISMMIPVVFLILPISILFALFPSLTSLNLFAS